MRQICRSCSKRNAECGCRPALRRSKPFRYSVCFCFFIAFRLVDFYFVLGLFCYYSPCLAFWLLLQSPTLLKSPTPLLIYQTPRFKFWAAASSAGRGGQPFRSERGEARSFFSSQPRFVQPVVFSGRPSPFLASFAATS